MSHKDIHAITPWRRSSHSTSGPETNCVEVAHAGPTIAIRDSKMVDDGHPRLTVDRQEWNGFLSLVAEK